MTSLSLLSLTSTRTFGSKVVLCTFFSRWAWNIYFLPWTQCPIFGQKIKILPQVLVQYATADCRKKTHFVMTGYEKVTVKKANYLDMKILWKILSLETGILHAIRQQELLKVSKFQKQIFLFSFEPKKQTKLFFKFCPSL